MRQWLIAALLLSTFSAVSSESEMKSTLEYLAGDGSRILIHIEENGWIKIYAEPAQEKYMSRDRFEPFAKAYKRRAQEVEKVTGIHAKAKSVAEFVLDYATDYRLYSSSPSGTKGRSHYLSVSYLHDPKRSTGMRLNRHRENRYDRDKFDPILLKYIIALAGTKGWSRQKLGQSYAFNDERSAEIK
ncbi:hypothetical protein KUW19_16310 [Ferrimonas balearica]|uniref:hypothetical protein n=1 Tax=Ferrimonas balearica TaxID=44012 RepID=UPI001C957310|nr:hypothetical protein [Ferrimonas balearica]MBY6108025.1 hypothetical protein [Ferrimonas balearica]